MAIENNKNLENLDQYPLQTIIGKLDLKYRGRLEQTNQAIKKAVNSETIWHEDLKKDFPKRAIIPGETAKQSYIRFFKESATVYLYAYLDQKDLYKELKTMLAHFIDTGIDGINESDLPIGIVEKYPFSFYRRTESGTEIPRFPSNVSYGLEIALSAQRFDKLLKTGHIDQILNKVTGLIKHQWGMEEMTQCFNPDKTLNEVEYYKKSLKRYSAKVVDDQLHIDESTYSSIPSCDVLSTHSNPMNGISIGTMRPRL